VVYVVVEPQQIIFVPLPLQLALYSSQGRGSDFTILPRHFTGEQGDGHKDGSGPATARGRAHDAPVLQLYAQSVNSSIVEAQESMLKAILRNGSNAVN
jgi:hypothetical protein